MLGAELLHLRKLAHVVLLDLRIFHEGVAGADHDDRFAPSSFEAQRGSERQIGDATRILSSRKSHIEGVATLEDFIDRRLGQSDHVRERVVGR